MHGIARRGAIHHAAAPTVTTPPFAAAAAASTASRSCLITAGGSAAPNMAEPATMTFAPAAAATPIVEGASPPSTSMSRSGNRLRSSATWNGVCGGDASNRDNEREIKEKSKLSY